MVSCGRLPIRSVCLRVTCTYSYNGAAPGAAEGNCPEPSEELLTFFEYSYQTTIGGIPTDTNRRQSVTDRTGGKTTYAYDGAARLTDATSTSASGATTRRHQYSYDDRGNLVKEQLSGTEVTAGVRTQAYNGANELCWTAAGEHAAECASTPAGATRYTFDAAGNMTGTSAGLQIGYSLRGHMITVTPPGLAAIEMIYTDATQDRRIEVDGIRSSYSQLGLVSQAPTNSSSKVTWFIRDPYQRLIGMLYAEEAKDDLYYLFDGHASVAATTDLQGQLVERYEYEPYGEEIDPVVNDANPWRYASGYYDSETKMVKFGTRYYMPDVARWTQPDPVFGVASDPATLNPYVYVGCDPINAVDPSGRSVDDYLWSCYGSALTGEVGGMVVGAASGAVAGGVGAGPGALTGLAWGSCGGLR
jgi:RHS repeat-associated protein